MDAQLRAQKEAFVSNLQGTTVLDVCLSTVVIPASFIILQFLRRKFFYLQGIPAFLIEFGLVSIPLVLSLTQTTVTSVIIFSYFMGACYILLSELRRSRSLRDSADVFLSLNSDHKTFISALRSLNLLTTCIAILAVDFRVFPRRFAKTENYGVSLMDVGVGVIQLFTTLTTRKARFSSGKASSGYWSQLKHTVFSCLPLFVLGLARFAVILRVGYQQHVSEYGTHWNFFFTLCFSAILFSAIPVAPQYYWLAAISILGGYQVVLSYFGVGSYLISNDRPMSIQSAQDLLWANKEGVFSLCGYVALAFVGGALGRVLFQKRRSIKEWRTLSVRLALFDAALWVALTLSWYFVEPPSRKMANLTYCLWVSAYFVAILLAFLVTQLVIPSANSGLLLESINFNGLMFFLLGNLLTGLVNLLVNTLAIADWPAIGILCCYTFILCGMTAVASTRGWQLNPSKWLHKRQ